VTVEDFDHDAYVRSRLPNFVLVGMGLGRRNQRPLPPSPDAARPVLPTRVSRRLTPPAAPTTPATRLTPPSGGGEPPEEEPAPATRPQRTREQRLSRAADVTVQAWVATPLVIIALLLIFVMINGPAEPAPIVVNDERGCDAPAKVITPAELSTPYWEECDK
jgi:hypothetical protein